MTDEWQAASVRVEAMGPAFLTAASALAERLGLPQEGEAVFALQVGGDGLQLVELVEHGPGPVRVDFVEGAAAHRRLHGGGSGQMIAKAVGVQAGVRPHVLDATAGLGRDAVSKVIRCLLGLTVLCPTTEHPKTWNWYQMGNIIFPIAA